MINRRVVVTTFLIAAFSGGLLVLPGCDSGGSDTGTVTQSAEQQATLDKIAKETAAAHAKEQEAKKKAR